MKNTIFLLVVTFLLQFNTLSFGQQRNSLIQHSQVDLFSSELLNLVQMVLDEPALFFTGERVGFGTNKGILNETRAFNIENIMEMEFISERKPITLREASIMALPNTVGSVKLDAVNWQSNTTVVPRPVMNLGNWKFKVGAGERAYF